MIIDKDNIALLLIIVGAILITIFFIKYGVEQSNINFEKCNNIGLEYLSVTKQVFGDDYIVCYNNLTKQTTQIPI